MRREEILINCIDDIQAGKYSLEEATARHPDLADELKVLCSIRCGINPEMVTAPAEFRQRARTRLIEEMASTRPGGYETIRSRVARLLAPAHHRGFGAAVGMLLLVIIGTGGTVNASRNTLPDDTLYPVKKLVERVRIAVTFSDESKANLHLQFAERRIAEVRRESSWETEVSSSALDSLAKHLDSAIKHIGELPTEDAVALLPRLQKATALQQLSLTEIASTMPAAAGSQKALRQAVDVTWRGNVIATASISDPSFLETSPSVRDDRVDSAYFEIEGTLLDTADGGWNIGGVQIKGVRGAPVVPEVGQPVRLKGLVTDNKTLVTEVEDRGEPDDDPADPVKIEGVFNGANQDGTVWSVGGISVGEIREVAVPSKGDRVKLGGINRGGIFTITEMNDQVRVTRPKDSDQDRDDDRRPSAAEPSSSRDSDDYEISTTGHNPQQSSPEQPAAAGRSESEDDPERDDFSPDDDEKSTDGQSPEEPPKAEVESPEEQEPNDPLETVVGAGRDERSDDEEDSDRDEPRNERSIDEEDAPEAEGRDENDAPQPNPAPGTSSAAISGGGTSLTTGEESSEENGDEGRDDSAPGGADSSSGEGMAQPPTVNDIPDSSEEPDRDESSTGEVENDFKDRESDESDDRDEDSDERDEDSSRDRDDDD